LGKTLYARSLKYNPSHDSPAQAIWGRCSHHHCWQWKRVCLPWRNQQVAIDGGLLCPPLQLLGAEPKWKH